MLFENTDEDWLIDENDRLETENAKLKQWVADCQSGMYVNCELCLLWLSIWT